MIPFNDIRSVGGTEIDTKMRAVRRKLQDGRVVYRVLA